MHRNVVEVGCGWECIAGMESFGYGIGYVSGIMLGFVSEFWVWLIVFKEV